METSQIGLDNNPAGSAVALGLAKVFKNYLMQHTSGKANALVSKISTKSLGKALIYANIANAANQTVADLLPHVNAAVTWVGALPANILNQTIGRIPVIGKIFRTLHNWITEGVSTIADFIGLDAIAETGRTFKLSDPNSGFETQIDWKSGKTGLPLPDESAQPTGDDKVSKTNYQTRNAVINSPKFYENLELHKTFTIPGAYTKKTVVNGTMATPKIIFHRLGENGLCDVSALRDRYTQKFSLIKAVRGLSETKYNIVDIVNYERVAKLALLEYYVVKKVVQAAKTYNLVQVNIGNNIITAYGFDPSEVRSNLANYETLLCQYHRMISNNLPMSGTWIERLQYLINVNIPDYSDAKVASYHMYGVCMTDVFYNPSDPTKTLTFDTIAGANNNSYSVMLANLSAIQAVVINNDKWQQLIADYFGAFGKLAMWEDRDYPAYSKPLDLSNGNSDLNREQIKNAMYLNAKLTVITIASGVRNEKIILDTDNATKYQFPNYTFGGTFSTAGAVAPQYGNVLDYDAYLQVGGSHSLNPGASGVIFLIPDKNGVGAQSVTATDNTPFSLQMDNHETVFTLHKDNYSEGECLEISQFKSRSIGVTGLIEDGNDKVSAALYYKTQEYALLDSTAFVFGSNGSSIVEQTYRICDEAISDDDLQDVESSIDYPDEMQVWALVDWMPMTHFTFFGYNSNTTSYSPRDILLCDFDSFGSLDDRAFITSVNYSMYSLYGAALHVGSKSKRIDNLNEVYKDKPTKKA